MTRNLLTRACLVACAQNPAVHRRYEQKKLELALIEKYGDQLIHLDGRPRRLLDEVEIDETPIWARE